MPEGVVIRNTNNIVCTSYSKQELRALVSSCMSYLVWACQAHACVPSHVPSRMMCFGWLVVCGLTPL